MHKFRRDVDHKLRVLQHADKIGDVGKACHYFGVGRASFYRWRTAFGSMIWRASRTAKRCPKPDIAAAIGDSMARLSSAQLIDRDQRCARLIRYHIKVKRDPVFFSPSGRCMFAAQSTLHVLTARSGIRL